MGYMPFALKFFMDKTYKKIYAFSSFYPSSQGILPSPYRQGLLKTDRLKVVVLDLAHGK
jgi:hypothetical protein